MPARSPVLALALALAFVALAPAGADEAPQLVTAAGLAMRLPVGWKQVPPASSMRAAQLEVPGPGGPAELTMFFFGEGQGGDFEQNSARWLGQLDAPSGSEPQKGELASVAEHSIRWVEAAGTLRPSTMGVGPSEPRPGSRLIGAMIEGKGGPWFLKLSGPDATVVAAKDSFLMMLRSASPAAPPAVPTEAAPPAHP